MSLSQAQMAEITGPVVSVDNDDFNLDVNPVNPSPPGMTLKIPAASAASTSAGGIGDNGAPTTPRTPMRTKGAHQIVSGSGDILSTSGGLENLGGVAMPGGKRPPPKFSSIMNEYVGACLEDNCNIGKTRIGDAKVSSTQKLLSTFISAALSNCALLYACRS